MKKNNIKNSYYIYILKCENDILYTGITTDYERRFDEHSGLRSNGAKFTKSHKPEEIVALWTTKTRSDASKLESRIKQLEKSDKLKLIDGKSNLKEHFVGLIDCRKFRRVLI